MTRPARPQEYGVGRRPIRRPSFRQEFKDALGRPMNGYASIRAADDSSVRAPVVGGVLEVDLQPGTYRIIAEVAPEGGQVQYITSTTTVGRYR